MSSLPENGHWSAAEAASALRLGAVSSRELVDAALDRIDRLNPGLTALVDVWAEAAPEQARAVDTAIRHGLRLGPLAGVPVAIKDNTAAAGHRLTYGVTALADNVASRDDPLVENLRGGGAVIVGSSSTPPWSWQWFTTSDLFGATRNARNPAYTPGGSSGGAASAVAAGLVPVAQGNDIAGSIRYPAYAVGVVGLRPTPGVVPGNDIAPRHKALSNQLFAVAGPLARSVEDAALGLEALRGYSPRDPVSVPTVQARGRGRRIGLYLGTELHPLDPPVEDAVLRAANALSAQGYAVEPLTTDVFEEAFELEVVLCFAEYLYSGREHIAEGGEILANGLAGPAAISEDLLGGPLTLDRLLDAYARRGSTIKRAQSLLEDYLAILTPASAQTPFLADEDQWADVSRRKEIVYAQWPSCATPVLGLPGIVVPTDVVWDQIPLGVHVIGRRFGEQDLLDVAQAVENVAGRVPVAEPIPAGA